MKRFNLFVGNYGSGKTEISINFALKLRESNRDVVLADIDVVNPYFRSSEHKDMLEAKGIKVVMPQFANTGIDLPTIPLDIYSVFAGNRHVVLDCGGDPAGATVLGSLKPHIEKVRDEFEVYFVLNTCRPLQSTVKQAIEMVKVIEHVSRVKVTALINNTNIANETTVEELLQGQEIAETVSKELGLPIAYISGKKEILDAYKIIRPQDAEKLFYLDIYMRPYWQES